MDVQGSAVALKAITLAQLRQLEENVYLCYATRAFNYATLTALLWDMLLTMQKEVTVIWNARWTITKSLYLVNRYITPFFVILHIWAFSGQARGLSDTTCRVIYSVSSVAAIISVSFVSLVMFIRLYAVYELSSRTFFLFLFYWFFTLLAFGGLTVPAVWGRLDHMRYSPSFNICYFNFSSSFWTILLPIVIEHGILFVFLIKNAMNTPKSCQSAALANMYRGGVLFYGFTFSILLSAMLTWRYFESLSSTAFTVGLFLTMATTRLLLHLKLRKRPRNPGDSQREVHPSQLKLADVPTMPFTPAPSEPRPVYKTPITGVKTPHSQVEGDHPFNASITNDARPVIPPSTTETIQQKFIKGKTNYPSHSTSFSLSSSASFSSTSRLTQNDPFRIHNLGRGSVQVEQTFIRQRAWWLFGSEYIPLETRVFINRQYGRDGIDGEKTMGGDGYAPSEDKSVLSSSRRHYERGISVSRLGWFDHWL